METSNYIDGLLDYIGELLKEVHNAWVLEKVIKYLEYARHRAD